MIYAYANFNLGDDLFIRVLCNRYPNTKFTLYGPKECRNTFQNIKNLDIVASDSFINKGVNAVFKILKLNAFPSKIVAKKHDGAIYIGGSIFMQQGNWELMFKRKGNMRIQGKPYFVLGANFGPFTDNEFLTKYKNEFKSYTDICFRDKYSYDLFKDLDNVRIADDVIFQIRKEEVPAEQREKNIVISVIKPSYRAQLADYDVLYYQKIRDISVYFIDKGYEVTLMSFCENEGDKEAINEIIDIMPKDYQNRVNEYLYKYNMEEALVIISNSDFVVGTRFHAMILGWVYNKPVFPIAYSKKMTNVMKDINFNGHYTDFENIHKLEAEQVFNSMETNAIDVSEQVMNAEGHFEKLDEYLLR